MAQQEYIKDLYENEEVSLREISHRTNLSFQTVRKYAQKENWSEDRLPNLEAENYPSPAEYIPTIDEWLEKDRKIPRKQRHTAMRVYHRLQEELWENDRKQLLTLPEHTFSIFRYESINAAASYPRGWLAAVNECLGFRLLLKCRQC